jgi:hypothetical protein
VTDLRTIPTLDQLAEHPERADDLSPEALPKLIGEAERLKAILYARLLTAKPEAPATATPPSVYLDSAEAATYAKMRKTRLDLWRRSGCLSAVRLGKGYGYRRADLDAFMARLAEAPQIRLAFMSDSLTVNRQSAKVGSHDEAKGHERRPAREDDHLPGPGDA